MQLQPIVDLDNYPLDDHTFIRHCKQTFDTSGSLVLANFLTSQAISQIVEEGLSQQHLAFFSTAQHNIYLKPTDSQFPIEHIRNRLISSSKGCITHDQIADNSPLKQLYEAPLFRHFLAKIFNQKTLFNYADPLSSINLHYASEGQELGWHFDESSFAITLLLQASKAGGRFEYIQNLRDADAGDMNFSGVDEALKDRSRIAHLEASAGTLTLFKGRDALHRVTPVEGDQSRLLAVLAYNSAPNIALSESARLTFYGRT
jgi:hypothetical protein